MAVGLSHNAGELQVKTLWILKKKQKHNIMCFLSYNNVTVKSQEELKEFKKGCFKRWNTEIEINIQIFLEPTL